MGNVPGVDPETGWGVICAAAAGATPELRAAALMSARSITSVICDWPKTMASASDSSFALWKRWAGSRLAARAHHASNASGRSGATCDGTGMGDTMIFMRRSPSASLSKGS